MADRGAFTLGGYTEEELAAMGLGEMTPMTRAGLAGDTIKPTTREQDLELSVGPEIAALLGYGSMPAQAYADQFGELERKAGDLLNDPSFKTFGGTLNEAGKLATYTNPIAGGLTSLVGMGTALGPAALQDYMSSGSAQAREPEMPIPPLPVQYNEVRYKADAEADQRRRDNLELERLRIQEEQKTKRQQNKEETAKQERLEKEAREAKRKADKIKRDFADQQLQRYRDQGGGFDTSAVKDVKDYLGGTETSLLGMLLGTAAGAATRKAGPLTQHLSAFGAGTSGGLTAQYAQDIADANAAAVNPERLALERWLEAAPQDDPDRERFQAAYDAQPLINPKSQLAQDRLLSFDKNQQRIFNALGEGGLGGITGLHVDKIGSAAVKGIPNFMRGVGDTGYEAGRAVVKPFKGMADELRAPRANPRQTGASKAKAAPKAAPKAGPKATPKKTKTQQSRSKAKDKRRAYADIVKEALANSRPVPKRPADIPAQTATKIKNAATESLKTGEPVSRILDKKNLGVAAGAGLAPILMERATKLEEDKS